MGGRSDLGSVPIRSASCASIVAIFADRTTEAAGKPVAARSDTATSPGQPRFAALVTITTQSSLGTPDTCGAATTRAGRRCCIGRFVKGKGTRTRSQTSQFGKGCSVGGAVPFGEGCERIVPQVVWLCPRQHHPSRFDGVCNFVTLS